GTAAVLCALECVPGRLDRGGGGGGLRRAAGPGCAGPTPGKFAGTDRDRSGQRRDPFPSAGVAAGVCGGAALRRGEDGGGAAARGPLPEPGGRGRANADRRKPGGLAGGAGGGTRQLPGGAGLVRPDRGARDTAPPGGRALALLVGSGPLHGG